MGTDCAPYLANLFLFECEFKWIESKIKRGQYDFIPFFKNSFRYIDDLLLINNDRKMDNVMYDIYPTDLVLNPLENDGKTCSFLDLLLTVEDKGVISTTIYDKRDAFGFTVVSLPDLAGNVPKSSSYGVYIGELVRYARGCTYFDTFKARTNSLMNKLTNQSFSRKRLISAFKRFCVSHWSLVRGYGTKILDFMGHPPDAYIIKFL